MNARWDIHEPLPSREKLQILLYSPPARVSVEEHRNFNMRVTPSLRLWIPASIMMLAALALKVSGKPIDNASKSSASVAVPREDPPLGLYTGLFFTTICAIAFRRTAGTTKVALILAVTALYTLCTLHAGAVWFTLYAAFIIHGETAASSLIYLLQNPLALVILRGLSVTLNTIIADCILIWRCWTVWNRNWKVVLLPILSTVAGAVLGFLSVVEQARYVISPTTIDRHAYAKFEIPYFVLSLVTTVITTGAIILRIFMMTDSSVRPGIARGYGRAIEAIVESALLYCIMVVVFLPFLILRSFNDGYPQAILIQVTGIAPTLIVARVSLGFARPESTWQEPTAPLSFAHSSDRPVSTHIDLASLGPSNQELATHERKSHPDAGTVV
ncbi:hypothetical protein DFH09DRAFT_1323408 [Mycena vulgaris]|nr:hypothetical protein DFH09DRAFT_1323408 [Mycena vulgaris]